MGSQRIKHLAQPSDEKIINLEEPTLSDDKGTKELSQHWRCKIILINGTRTMTENLNINNEKIINLADPTSNQDASRKKYVNTVTNNINMTNHYMKNFRSPIYSFDAANKAYVDPKTSSASDPSIKPRWYNKVLCGHWLCKNFLNWWNKSNDWQFECK